MCQPLSPVPVLEDVDDSPQDQGITHSTSYPFCTLVGQKGFWESFNRNLLTPRKETQFQSWTLETESYNRKCQKQFQQKTLEKKIMMT